LQQNSYEVVCPVLSGEGPSKPVGQGHVYCDQPLEGPDEAVIELAVGEAVEFSEATLSGRGILENVQIVEGKCLLDITGSQDLDPGDIMPELCHHVAEVNGVRDGGAGEGAGSVEPSPNYGEFDRPEIHI
jgi:hypothetical protein